MTAVVDGTNGFSLDGNTLRQSVLMTAQATTSGTSKDFTGIPSWVKRVTVVFSGVSTNGSNAMLVQVGSGSVQASGYNSGLWSGTSTNITATTGFIASISNSTLGFSGIMTLMLVSPNNWVATCISSVATTANIGYQSIGTVSLSGPLDRVRFTTNGSTDAFDAGSVNILYE
jgi:hypothetical protein